MPETVDESKDVEYRIWWNQWNQDDDVYPYIHKTMNGVNQTIEDVSKALEAFGIRLNKDKIIVKSRVVLTQSSEWVDETTS